MRNLATAPQGQKKVTRTFETIAPSGERVVVTFDVTACSSVGYPKGLTTWDGCDPQSDLGGARRDRGLKKLGQGDTGCYGSVC